VAVSLSPDPPIAGLDDLRGGAVGFAGARRVCLRAVSAVGDV
jgi:hypothetical protein